MEVNTEDIQNFVDFMRQSISNNDSLNGVQMHFLETFFNRRNDRGNAFYDQIFTVDKDSGDTIAGKSAQAKEIQDKTSQKILIYVPKNVYEETNIAQPEVDMYFERNAIVYTTQTGISNSIISDFVNGAGNYRIYGYGRFHGHNAVHRTIRFSRNGTKFYIEAEQIDQIRCTNDNGASDIVGTVTAPSGYRCKILSNFGSQNDSFRMTAKNCDFDFPWYDIGSFQSNRATFLFDGCKFSIDDTVHTGGAAGPNETVLDVDGNPIPLLDGSGNLELKPDNQWETYLDNSSLTQQQFVDDTSDSWQAAAIIRLVNTNTDDVSVVFRDCEFEVASNRFIGLKVLQSVEAPNATIVVDNCWINDTSGGSETTGVVFIEDSNFTNKARIIVMGLQSRADTRVGAATGGNADLSILP